MVALFMITTLLLFLAVDYVIQRRAKKQEAPARTSKQVPERFLIPRGYFFGSNHSWVELLPSGKIRLGIDDFVQKLIGKVDNIWCVPSNTPVARGNPLFMLKQGQRTLSISSPISGKVVDFNQELQKEPDLLTGDPYVAGWVAVMEPVNISNEIKTLKVGEETAQWLRREVSRFRDFIKAHTPQFALAEAGPTMADGGIPMRGILQHADEHAWKEFEEEFLTAK